MQYISVEFSRIRLRLALSKIRRFVHDAPNFLVHALEVVFGCLSRLDQAKAHLLDGIMLMAHFLDLFLRPVFCRIGHGMAAIALAKRFEEKRPLPLARPSHGL